MSSPQPSELNLEQVRAVFADWLQLKVTDIERIGGGRNSQVYKVTVERAAGARPGEPRLPQGDQGVTPSSHLEESAGERRYSNLKIPAGSRQAELPAIQRGGEGTLLALKAYFRHPNDQRDRLATEYNSFSHLWVNGLREIPQPLACNPKLGWAIYQFIEGEKIPPGQATESEVLAAVDLLGRLRELSRNPESRKLGVASEACFAPSLIVENVRQRLERVRSTVGGVRTGEPEQTTSGNPVTPVPSELPPAELSHSTVSTPYSELGSLLYNEFTPFLEQVARWSEARLKAAGQSFTEELDFDLRTLSPSDFGFHNALRQPGGRIIFLDFEYFGWDDPAKMIVDFLLHPAMTLSPASKRVFARGIFRRFADWPGLRERVESVYPLFGLKWCMIFLNEFLPDAYLRRQFAATAPADRAALQREQLAKARRMLERIRNEYQAFPYHA